MSDYYTKLIPNGIEVYSDFHLLRESGDAHD